MAKALNLSIRYKIAFLLSASLLLSGAAFVILGTSLIVSDKTAYVYDFTASQVRLFSNQLTAALGPILSYSEAVQGRGSDHFVPSFRSIELVSGMRVREKTTGPKSRDGFLDLSVSEDAQSLRVTLGLQDGRVIEFTDDRVKVSGDSIPNDFSLCVASLPSKKLLYKLEQGHFKEVFSCSKLLRGLSVSFVRGAQEVISSGVPFIVSYEKILSGNMVVLSVVPKEIAFQTAQSLVLRSVILGVAVFFLMLGASLLLIRRVIRRIEELTEATHEIAGGNFDIQLPESHESEDEVMRLSYAFSVMKEKIKALLVETADKARMENELETAKFVQKRLLPQAPYSADGIYLEGLSQSASECGGDFWHFARVGDQIYFVFGDITGHGVSAALLTAAVHGVFFAFIDQLSQSGIHPVDDFGVIHALAERLNGAVFKAAGGEASFPCLVGVVNLKASMLTLVNHGHPSPYMWVPESLSWGALKTPRGVPLGSGVFQAGKELAMPLTENFKCLFYTDGLYDQRISDGKALSKRSTVEHFSQLMRSAEPGAFSSLAMEHALQFFGDSTTNRPDDITLLVIEKRS